MPETNPSEKSAGAPTPEQLDWAAEVHTVLGLSSSPDAAERGGTLAISEEENARLAGLQPDALAQTDLTVCDTAMLFSEAYMTRLSKEPIKGEGEPRLRDLMREIVKGVSGPRRVEAMHDLAQIVGAPPTADRLDLDYGRFLIVRTQQTVNGQRIDDTVPGLDESMHPDFMASRGQLMFGKVLGDAFGIHEVFAALLSPTGGLVGPGNWLIPGVVKAGNLAPDNPVALHGTVHDAAGYLLTFHGEGPGYNYRENKIEILGTDNPLSGQISGIGYWVKEAGDDYVARRVEAKMLEVERKLKSARDAVAAGIERKLAESERTAKQIAQTAKAMAGDAKQAMLGIADAIRDGREKVKRSALMSLKKVTGNLFGRARGEATRELEAAYDLVWN